MTSAAPGFPGRIHQSPTVPTILWDLLKPCNFSCDYCYSERITLRPRHSTGRGVAETLAAFAGQLPGWNVNLSGGEPLIHPDSVDIMAGLAGAGHRVGLYTNLSMSAKLADLCARVDPAGVEFINAGVHAMQRAAADPRLEVFARDFALVKGAGFPIHASYIIHPENLHRVRDDLRRLRERGVDLRVQVFRGMWQGATYPAAFTASQLALVEQWEAGLDRGRDVRLDYTADGTSCVAGMVYLEMDPNGDCWRCGSYRSMRRQPLGNLFDGTLRVRTGPQRCTMWACLSCRQGHAFALSGLRDLAGGHQGGG